MRSGEGSSLYEARIKRAFDVVVSTLLLAFTAPVQIGAMAAVKAGDGGPVFYTHERAGKNGRTFKLYKLRTMRVGTDARYGAFPTADAVTRPGRILRRLSLDELPQLWNIVKGDMSIVGPRPTLVEHVARYTPRQARRLEVRPGLTGLAQIRYRNEAPWSVRLEADVDYVDRVSFLLDLRILLATLPAVLSGTGQTVGQTAADVDDLAVAEPLATEPLAAGGAREAPPAHAGDGSDR